jgi:hypothetical protein
MTPTDPSTAVDRTIESHATERKASTPASSGFAVPFLLACVLAVLVVGFALNWAARAKSVTFSTSYQAVLLSNGAVYFGKLQGYGTPDPVLTDVFYVVTNTDPNTKQVSNVLVKRGKELHGPDRMYLNPNQIVFVETVSAGSKVSQLIAQAGNQ